MPERSPHQLHPETRRALRLAEATTGMPARVAAVDHLPGGVRAALLRPERPSRPYEIRYRRDMAGLADHLIAHEVGHIVRLHRVPPEERKQAAVTATERELVARQLVGHVAPLLASGLSAGSVADLIVDWHHNLVTQLANFPADLRIEQWLYDDFPRLRPIQERSLLREVGRSFPLLDPLVRALTPEVIYRPTMAMNAAQAVHTSRLFGRPELLDPFRTHGLIAMGERLAHLVFDPPDRGYRSDMATADAWARELGLTGWFVWLSPKSGHTGA